jgi:hypothetical protein
MGAWREAVTVADEVAADIASLELNGPPRLSGELAIALALVGDHDRATVLAQELIAAGTAVATPPVHASPVLDAATALLVAGVLPAPDLLATQRPSCVTCQVSWHVIAGRSAALHGDANAALAWADALEELSRKDGHQVPAGSTEHIRALAFGRSGRSQDRERAEALARAAYRAAERVDAETFLDLDLARVSPVDA